MFKLKNQKRLLKLLTTSLIITTALPLTIAANQLNYKQEKENTFALKKEVVVIKNKNQKINNDLTSVIGARRYEVFVSSQFNLDLQKLAQEIVNKIFKESENLIKYQVLKNLNIISFAIAKVADTKVLNEHFNSLITNNKAIDNVYLFETNYTYNDFLNQKRPKLNAVSNAFIRNNYNFDNAAQYDWINEQHYKTLGLDEKTRKNHFQNFFSEPVTIGLLDQGGVVRHNSRPFHWNNTHGNGVHWRDEPFYIEWSSNHSDQAGEIMVGKKGINQTAKLWSVMVDLFWNGVTGEIEFLLSKNVNIITNIWNLDSSLDQDYAGYSHYFDQVINKNPEIISIVAAGNQNPENPLNTNANTHKYITGIALSKNSIVVGAVSSENKARFLFSQVGRDNHYLTVAAPGGGFVFSSSNAQTWGTTNAAATIAGLLSMVYQRNKNIFNKGQDSIIAKSALISGSTIPPTHNYTYLHETGYGIPKLDLVDQAVKNLRYYRQLKKGTKTIPIKLKKGQTIRLNATWNYLNYYNNLADIDISIKNKNQTINVSSSSSDRNTETIDFTAPETAWYVIEVKRYNSEQYASLVDVAVTYVIKEKGNN